MGYNIDSITDDCYPNTTILINKLGIKTKNILMKLRLQWC